MLATDLAPDSGTVKWSVRTPTSATWPRTSDQFQQGDINLFDWMAEHRQPGDDDQSIRSALGRLLFSGDDSPKAP